MINKIILAVVSRLLSSDLQMLGFKMVVFVRDLQKSWDPGTSSARYSQICFEKLILASDKLEGKLENHYPPFETSLGIDFSVLGQFSCHMVFTYQLESQRMEAFTQENCNVLLIKNVWISSGVPLRLQQIDTGCVLFSCICIYTIIFSGRNQKWRTDVPVYFGHAFYLHGVGCVMAWIALQVSALYAIRRFFLCCGPGTRGCNTAFFWWLRKESKASAYAPITSK